MDAPGARTQGLTILVKPSLAIVDATAKSGVGQDSIMLVQLLCLLIGSPPSDAVA
jgi:hypothetical protein